jgi:putative ABC transport system permease protein
MRTLFGGHIKAGFDSVRGAKMRNFWTTLGVIIGVTSVITVVSIGEGIKQQIGGQIHHFGNDLITVRPAQIETGSGGNANNVSILSGLSVSGSLTSKDVETVTAMKGVGMSAPLTLVNGTVKGENGAYDDGFVIGTTSDLPSLLNQSIADGVFLASDDDTNVAVLGAHAAERLFNEDVPLGHTFRFHGQDFMVQGIFNTFTTTPLSQQADFNNAIFIPHNVAEDLTNKTAPTYEVLVRADKKQQTQAVAAKIQQSLDKSHGGASGFSVLTGDQNLTADNAILELLTRLIAGVAAISLLVGGIGIMNVMLVSVAERMHEIGIRKAVGATNQQILSQFMIESTLLSLTGGVIGIILSLVIDLGLRLTTDLKPVITWQIVVIATAVSLTVGIIFGMVPAIKAARKDPIEALRSE